MTKLPWWLNLILRILFVDLLIVFLIGVWSWIVQDFNVVSLSNRFFIGGTIVILISLASGIGNWGHRSDWQQMLAQSAGQANLKQRNARMLSDMVQVYGFALVMIPAGLIAILVAVLLGQFG